MKTLSLGLLLLVAALATLGTGCAQFTESPFMKTFNGQEWLKKKSGMDLMPADVFSCKESYEQGPDLSRRRLVGTYKMPQQGSLADLTKALYADTQTGIAQNAGQVRGSDGDAKGDFAFDYRIGNNKGLVEFYFAETKNDNLKIIAIVEERPVPYFER